MVVVIVGKDALCGIHFPDKYLRRHTKVMWDEGTTKFCMFVEMQDKIHAYLKILCLFVFIHSSTLNKLVVVMHLGIQNSNNNSDAEFNLRFLNDEWTGLIR